METFPPPPTLLIFGAVHVAQPLSRFAKALGFDVIVSDARAKLATTERFPDADRIIQGWPDETLEQVEILPNTYVAILSHDPKFDEPALVGTLSTPAAYIGAIGSRSTNEDRRRRLAAAGMSPEQVARMRAPIGLDIGAATPEEMAISILGEIIALRRGRSGGSLTHATRPHSRRRGLRGWGPGLRGRRPGISRARTARESRRRGDRRHRPRRRAVVAAGAPQAAAAGPRRAADPAHPPPRAGIVARSGDSGRRPRGRRGPHRGRGSSRGMRLQCRRRGRPEHLGPCRSRRALPGRRGRRLHPRRSAGYRPQRHRRPHCVLARVRRAGRRTSLRGPHGQPGAVRPAALPGAGRSRGRLRRTSRRPRLSRLRRTARGPGRRIGPTGRRHRSRLRRTHRRAVTAQNQRPSPLSRAHRERGRG